MSPRTLSNNAAAAAKNKGVGPDMDQSGGTNTPGNDEWESGEQAVLTHLQASPSRTPQITLAKTSPTHPPSVSQTSLVGTLNNAGQKSSILTSRRRQLSIPGPKSQNGQRLWDLSNKRSVSHTAVPQFNTVSGASAVASQDPYTHQLSINDISRFSFASITPENPTPKEEKKDPLDFGDFLSPISFDDFHNSITTSEPSLSHFPLPGRGGMKSTTEPEERRTLLQPAIPIATSRKISGQGSLGRKSSTSSNYTARTSSKSESMSTPENTVLRGRRQSQFPPNAFHSPVAKAPRKSVGPITFLPPDDAENTGPHRKPSVGGKREIGDRQKDSALSQRLASRPGNHMEAQALKVQASPRSTKSHTSFLAPNGQSSKELVTPSRTPDHLGSSPSTVPLTPSRPGRSNTPGRTGTPGTTSTSNRRMSVMPPHAKGLGARTISPTDARRMKRMSTMPPAPPLPESRLSQAPPTPLPEMPILQQQSKSQSPAPPLRKSSTPSSSRTTPDPNRKSYSSAQSLSSSTSYGSQRNSTLLSQRFSQAGSSSRLPTPKPRLDTSNLEDVPPVPAIPKAYESPQSEVDQPFFSARSSSLPAGETPVSDSPYGVPVPGAFKSTESPLPHSPSSRKSALGQEGPEVRPQPEVATVKKSFQSMRLPAFNLLPISTPNSTKTKALKEPKAPVEDRSNTSPTRRNLIKTPSTPMTASKASFFSRSQRQREELNPIAVRSSTSHNTLRTRVDEHRPPTSASPSSLPPFSFDGDSTNLRSISPFVSFSLPKTSAEFSSFMQPNFGSDLNRATTQVRPSGPRAPSFSMNPKVESKAATVETESSFSAAALRRKLARKRSDSRTQETADQQAAAAVKYDNMPPPKLPASATWGNFASLSSSPTQKANYLKSRRKASASNISIPSAPERQDSYSSVQSVNLDNQHSSSSSPSLTLNQNISTSFLSSTHSLLSNSPNGRERPSDSGLDRDDMLAEEEMKKLATKRKDFESAARELDGLRRRARPAECVSPNQAVQRTDLNIFERGEIIDYPDVYFTGTRSAKKIVGDLTAEPANFGYDDERGDYNIVEGDHLAYRYEVVDLLGKGSFGQVVRCIDHKTGILVAIKIIRNKKRFHQQALVEVNILQKLREWDPNKMHSVVNFEQSFYFRGHLCISTDLLGMNLYEFIKAHDFRGFSLKLIRRFTKQLLSSLILLHSHKVIHCDLKPENILLAHPIHSEIKVIDFGSSCFENEKVYTYIQSRFYRSPEVILGMSYGMPIDMWSLGCILAELFTGYPIFPGENEQEQLACIMEVFGPPERHLIEKSSRKKLFFDSMGKPRPTVSSKGRRRRPSSKELRQVLKCDDEAFLDFLSRCLKWDPARRMTPHEANRHEFISGTKLNPTGLRKHLPTSISSPIKRVNSVTANGGIRPLPQPPTTSFKNGIGVRQDLLTSSPNKPGASAAARRQSNMNGFQPSNQAKRASHAAMSTNGTNLHRIGSGQKPTNAKFDYATAAAAASLMR